MQHIEDRQWQAIAILTTLGGVEAVDIGMRSGTGSFQMFENLSICGGALDDALAACRARNRRDCDIYFRPARGIPANVVMLDDLTRDQAMNVAAGNAYMLVETSPLNYQLWLKADRALAEEERKAVQRALVHHHGGDPASVSGEHFGRLPGFKNRKPKHNLPWVNLIRFDVDAPGLDVFGLSCPMGACALEPPAGVPLSVHKGGAPQARSPSSPRSVSGGDSQESHKEFKFACESLRHKVNRDAIISNLTDRALARGKRRTATQAEQYAARTVAAAERALNRVV